MLYIDLMRTIHFASCVLPGEVCHFATSLGAASEAVGLHSHDFHEIFWVEAGMGTHHINGQKRRLQPGMLVLIRAADCHGFNATPESALRMSNFAFRLQRWQQLRRRYWPHTPDPFQLADSGQREWQLSEPLLDLLGRYAEELRLGVKSAAATDRFLLNVMYVVAHAAAARSLAAAPVWLQKALESLEDPRHFADGTAGLCRLTGRRQESVARTARRCLGKTPTELLNDARLRYAAKRLGESSADILDICMDCGFASLSHFYRLFRNRYGISPKKFRRHRTLLGMRS
jgi:AraC family cel operon transcriptional repressor